MKTMLIDTLILLVLSMNVIDGLWCIQEDSIEMSLIELTHDEFREEMNLLDRDDYNDSAGNMVCGIIITVDYAAKELTIDFDPGSVSVVNRDIGHSATLYTKFTRTPDRNRISELFITCSFEDMCDEKFITVNNHSQWWWLIDEADHTGIEQRFEKLFIKDEPATSTIRCYNNWTITSCSFKQCRMEESSENGLYKMCVDAPAKNYLTIETIVLTDSEIRQLEHHIVYTCQFDICNEQSIFLTARNITYTYYNVTPMLRIFNKKPTTEPTSASIMIQFTTESTSTGDHLRVSTKLLVFIFPFVICLS